MDLRYKRSFDYGPSDIDQNYLKEYGNVNTFKFASYRFEIIEYDSEKPFDRKIWRVELQNELKLMGIKNYREIVFHSWRHFFTTYIEPSLTHSDLQKVTGHLTERMLEHYADHETERALTNVGKAVENILVPIACLDKR